MSILIGRHENGISLNDLEFLLDAPEPEGNVLEFETKQLAKEHLKTLGVNDEVDLEDCFVYYDTITRESM